MGTLVYVWHIAHAHNKCGIWVLFYKNIYNLFFIFYILSTQTQWSLKNIEIGGKSEKMHDQIIQSFGVPKKIVLLRLIWIIVLMQLDIGKGSQSHLHIENIKKWNYKFLVTWNLWWWIQEFHFKKLVLVPGEMKQPNLWFQRRYYWCANK